MKIPFENEAIKVHYTFQYNDRYCYVLVRVDDNGIHKNKLDLKCLYDERVLHAPKDAGPMTKRLAHYNAIYVALELIISSVNNIDTPIVFYIPSKEVVNRIYFQEPEDLYESQLEAITDAAGSFIKHKIPIYFKYKKLSWVTIKELWWPAKKIFKSLKEKEREAKDGTN